LDALTEAKPHAACGVKGCKRSGARNGTGVVRLDCGGLLGSVRRLRRALLRANSSTKQLRLLEMKRLSKVQCNEWDEFFRKNLD
jgi:hypothetical protein